MQTFRQLRGALVAMWLGLCTTAFAAAPPPLDVTSHPAAGLAGSIVTPRFDLAVDGFELESFDLTVQFTDPVLSFELGSSTVRYNGTTRPWTALPGYFAIGPATTGDIGSFQLSALSLQPDTLSGTLELYPAFRIRNAAPLGDTTVSVTGSIGSDPQLGERYFDSSATITVSAVPEPEVWLLWLGGIGLLAWKRARRRA